MKFTSDSFTYGGQPYMNEPEYFLKESGEHFHNISPDDYITHCSEIMGLDVQTLIGTRKYDDESYFYIEEAARNMQLTIPVLDFKNNIQNGLHRAIWAKKQGMELIPVFIYR